MTLNNIDKEKIKEKESNLITLLEVGESLEECYNYIAWPKLSTFLAAKEKLWRVIIKLYDEHNELKSYNGD